MAEFVNLEARAVLRRLSQREAEELIKALEAGRSRQT